MLLSHIYFYLYDVIIYMTLKVIFASFVLMCSISMNAQLDFSTPTLQTNKISKERAIDLSIYPNPTTDFFLIKNGTKVDQVVIYNWLGKRIESYTHYKGRIYNVEDLDKGIYIVRLFNKNNKAIKVVRLHRN